jgi:hypothetical protein
MEECGFEASSGSSTGIRVAEQLTVRSPSVGLRSTQFVRYRHVDRRKGQTNSAVRKEWTVQHYAADRPCAHDR